MKKIITYIASALVLLFLLNGCGSADNSTEDLYQYEGSLIGDNSAVISIIEQLELNEAFQEVALITKTEPYGMTVTYEGMDAELTDFKEMAITNAAFLFALVENAEWTIFDFDDREYKVTKAELEDFYGKELSDFTGEEELKSVTKELLRDDNSVNQLFESEG